MELKLRASFVGSRVQLSALLPQAAGIGGVILRRRSAAPCVLLYLLTAFVSSSAALSAASDSNAPRSVARDALTTMDAPPAGAPPTTTDIPPEIVVEAPEPRYAAPTLRDRIGRIWVPALINGEGPFRLVLDTGSTSSAVIPRVLDTLRLPLDSSGKRLVHGVTGSAIVPTIEVSRLEVGDLRLEDTVLPIVADVFGGAEGVLGTRGLADKRVHIDFGEDFVRIVRSRRQRAAPGFIVIPLDLDRNLLPTVDAKVGHITVKAVIDTGAQQTLGNEALRAALLRKPKRVVETEEIVGVTLDVDYGESIATPPIQLGAIGIRGLRVTFGDMFIFEHWKMIREPAMLIGMDVLGSLDVLVIDYKLRELQIRRRT
jgi:hypothetical protein